LFLLFVFFCQVWLQLQSILFRLLKVSQAHLKLVASGWLVGSSMWPAVACVRLQLAGGSGQRWWCGGGSCLFPQCTVAWRRLPQARGSGCQNFDSPWCFTSAEYGSSVLGRSLIHRAQKYYCITDKIYRIYFKNYYYKH
jgi:hypothetical protein